MRIKTLFSILVLIFGQSFVWAGSDSIPQQISFQGNLTDALGNPLNETKSMRFGVYLDKKRIWYAQYSAVKVLNGVFAISLGGSTQNGQALDLNTGNPVAKSLAIASDLFLNQTSASVVEVELEIENGTSFELVAPRFAVTSSMFALKSAMVGELNPSMIARQDTLGRIASSNGNAVIAADGSWIGPTTGMNGAPGPAGPPGPPGIQGATGLTGPIGLPGVAGPKGDTGATGPTGPIGLPGVAGPKGDIGSEGPIGKVGATGPSGPKGDTGSEGPIGKTGATGATGPIGLPGIAGPKGETGANGSKGETGATGPAGPKGDTGSEGPIGKTGATGATGPIGLPGVAGPKGETGANGSKGETGAIGATGPIGPAGLKGETGATGPAGPKGDTGSEGPIGKTGATGATGPIGLPGVTGPKGETGATGPIGPPGIAGPKGETGAIGATGPAGSNAPAFRQYTLYSNSANSRLGKLPATPTEFPNGVSQANIDFTAFTSARFQYSAGPHTSAISARIEYSLDQGKSWEILIKDLTANSNSYQNNTSSWTSLPFVTKGDVLIRAIATGNGKDTVIVGYVRLDVK